MKLFLAYLYVKFTGQIKYQISSFRKIAPKTAMVSNWLQRLYL